MLPSHLRTSPPGTWTASWLGLSVRPGKRPSCWMPAGGRSDGETKPRRNWYALLCPPCCCCYCCAAATTAMFMQSVLLLLSWLCSPCCCYCRGPAVRAAATAVALQSVLLLLSWPCSPCCCYCRGSAVRAAATAALPLPGPAACTLPAVLPGPALHCCGLRLTLTQAGLLEISPTTVPHPHKP